LLLGEAGSFVFGSVSDGVFEGKIVSPHGSYYVEKAHRYFPNNSNKSFHSVIYSEADILDPYEHLRTGKWSCFILFVNRCGDWKIKILTHEICVN
jgi:disintegrin and metalloproteinase domain-containing protein 10